MYFYDPQQRAQKNICPGVNTRTFWGENMLLGVVSLDANAVLPAHSHPHEQATYVVEGELEMDIEGKKRWLHAGELAIIPGGAVHSVIVGPKDARVIDIFAPAREDMKY